MRILSISAQKPHSTGSGVYLNELVRAFSALGHQQAVVAGVYHEDTSAFPEGVAFYPVFFKSLALPFPIAGMSDEMPYESTLYSQMTPDMLRLFQEAFLRRIRQAVEEFRPELILCHHLYILTALAREAFPDARIYGICHGTDLRQLQSHPLLREYVIAQSRRLDGVFCLHAAQKEALCSYYGLASEQVRIAGSGYNSRIFYRMPELAPHEGFHIVFAGKISEKKGLFSLLRALDYLPYERDALHVSLAGGYANADYARTVELIERCPYAVELLGNLPQEELARLFNACDLFVLPSYYEALPLVLFEAMACGAKLICTDLPGIREWMDAQAPGHGIRFLAPPPMQSVGVPVGEALPAFERSLAKAIVESLAAPAPKSPPTQHLHWESVAARILDA